jgi:glycine oxidase
MSSHTPSPSRFHALIVGGGTIGLSLAWELSQRGRSVAVLDSSDIGGGASWAGAGILPPAPRRQAVDPYEQLQAFSHQLHPEWARRLKQETGIDNGFRRCGGIYLARTLGEQATLAANHWWWQEHGIESHSLNSDQLTALEPSLSAFASSTFKSAWLLPDECQLRNPRHLKSLARACVDRGVNLFPNAPVKSIDATAEGVQLHTPHQTFFADQVCICSGAWARLALLNLGIDNGIMPVRGQIVLYRSPQPLLSHVVNEGHRYLVPRNDGLLLAGSVEEEVGYVNQTTEEAIQQIRRWAEGLLPALTDCTVERCWSGLRPGSYDTLPYLGHVPGHQNLFVAAGHFRSGLYLSCGTAVVMADLMLGATPAIDLHPFRVGR